jgi:hypothetical protein
VIVEIQRDSETLELFRVLELHLEYPIARYRRYAGLDN